MNARILKILLKKEIALIKRNPIIPRLIVGMPVWVMLIIPLVTTLDVKNVGVAVVDNDRTELSRRIVSVPANRRRRNGRHHHHPERLPAGFDQRPAA